MPALAELKNVVVQIAVSDTIDFLLRITGLFQCPGDLLQCRGIGESFRAGTDTVKVGSDETPVRVLDEEVSTDQARWHNRYWIDSEGQIRQSEQYLGADYFPVKTTLIKAAKQ